MRASGDDRYAVAARVNALAQPTPAKGVAYLTSGHATGTAFAAASLAGLSKRPLYYALPYCVPASARPALVRKAIERSCSWAASAPCVASPAGSSSAAASPT